MGQSLMPPPPRSAICSMLMASLSSNIVAMNPDVWRKSNSNSNSNTIVSSNHAVSNNHTSSNHASNSNTSNNNHSSLANQPTNQQTTSHSGGSSDDSSSSDRTRSGSILPRATSWMRTGSSGRRVAFGLARHSSSKSSTTSSSSRACGTQPGSQGIRPTHLVMPTPVLLALHQSSSLMRMQTLHGSWLKLTAFLNTTPCSQANGEMVHVMFAWALTSPTF